MASRTPLQQFEADVRRARTFTELREARQRLELATRAATIAARRPVEELRGDAPAPEPTTAQRLTEAFVTYGLPTDQAATAAAGRYNAPVKAPAPAPRKRDTWDQLAEARHMSPAEAEVMRRGRYA